MNAPASETLLGIDLGTQSIRAGLFTPAGRLIAWASQPQEIATPRPGWSQQNPQAWWDLTASAVQDVLASSGIDASTVVAIGCGGQMHGPVPVRADGTVGTDAIQLWNDKRPAELVRQHRATPAAASLHAVTANPPAESWTGFKIQWLREHEPDTYATAWRFLVPKDFINYRLTGVAATDWSEASGSYLLDANMLTWSNEATAALGIDPDTLPPIHTSTDVIGTVTSHAAEQTGLLPGTPVVAGGGDMLCTLLASGLWRSGLASDITGTSSILSVFADQPVRDQRMMNLHHVCEGWVPFGILDSGGLALRWYRDHFAPNDHSGSASYERLIEDAAGAEPAAGGLLFLPHLLGERTLGSPHARGALVGLTPRHGSSEIIRSILEGITFDLRRSLNIIEEVTGGIDQVIHSGGGARSASWSQIKADIYQKPVSVLAQSEGGLYGAAMLAAVGAGMYDDAAAAAAEGIEIAHTYEPNLADADRYDEAFELFVDIHDRLQPSFDRLAATDS